MVKITKITIEIGKKKLELTLDEVKKLRDELNSLAEKENVWIPWTYPQVNPSPWYPVTTYSGTIELTDNQDITTKGWQS